MKTGKRKTMKPLVLKIGDWVAFPVVGFDANHATICEADREFYAAASPAVVLGLCSRVRELEGLLRLVQPHIPPSAIDYERAQNHKVRDCYLRDMVADALQSQPSESTNE